MDKDFYVSPFIEMVGRYTVRVRDEPARLRISINEDQDEGLLLHTSIDLTRRPLTDRTVARMLVRHPFITQKTIGLIHWHALRLWRRGAPFHQARSGSTMTTRTAAGQAPAIMDTILAKAAWRVGRAAAARMRVGCLTVVLPDGSREVFGDRSSAERGEIHIHDNAALVRMLVGGETGGGEAYMDGLWSSPDLAALLRVAALNREALALSAGWWRVPAPAPADLRPSAAAQHAAPEPTQHRRALRSGQRLLPALPGRDDDLLERRLRVAGPVAGRCPAQQVPAHRGGRRTDPRATRPGDRYRLGRLRALRGRRARLPGDLDHDLPGAARPRPRARPGGRPRGPRRHPAARLPRDQWHLRRDRLHRDARGGRRRVLRDVLPDLRRGAGPRRAG